jgi:tetratricopeptide (TPR) repeat protein
MPPAWAMFNSAEALANIGELEKAENYCISALNICESQDDKIGMNGVFRCLGIIYRFKKQWNKAIENVNKSIVILEMLDIPFDLATTYYELGLVYREMGEVRGAIDNFGIAKNYYESVGAKNQAEETAKIIRELETAKK